MNKKFSTLMAAFLLAANVGTFTADAMSFDTKLAYKAATADAKAKGKGYETGKSYLLQVEDGKYLAVVKNSDGKYGLKVVENSRMNGLDDLKTMMWTVSVNSQVGSKTAYTFVNNYAQIVLAADVNTAKANTDDDILMLNVLAGGITEWFSAPSYKEPAASQPLYANAGNDKVIVLKHDASSNNVYAVLVKASAFDPAANDQDYLKITPYVATNYVLSANDLNTMLGAAGPQAKEDSYFTLNFDPAMESLFTDSKLQAVKVENKELVYGSTTQNSSAAYASLKEVDNAYRNTSGGYVALKNPKGEYIVADTAYIAGTDNNSNGLIKFTTDGLYNAKNNTRLRQPGSYLFKFLYNPSDGTVDIRVQSYIRKSKDYLKKAAVDANDAKITNNETTFYTSYDKKFVQLGSYWTNVEPYTSSDNGGLVADTESDGTTTEATNVFITRALLGETNYATLGEQTPASVGTESNIIDITLGAKNIYKPIVMAQGAYLLQVAGSINKQDIGKYWVNNLIGGWELAEQAIRQNYQHMPAAQWVLVNTGSAAAVYNREFEGKASSGILYGVEGHADQAFFMGGDTLKFIPVAAAMDKYLGYKFVEDKNLDEQLFTFNYLHDLAMDKPINTINNKDSVVWVDKNGEDMKFVLEKVIDDAYGFNGDLKNVSALNRRVYYVRVKDATKLKNNGRYLAYDAQLKKYVVSNTTAPTPFFLKENNEVEGGDCYYTLLKANCVYVGNIATKEVVRDEEGREYIPGLDVTPVEVNETTWYTAGTVTDADLQVVDNDIVGSFAAHKGTVFNASGIAVEGIVPDVYYASKNDVDFINNIPLTTESELNANGWKLITEGDDNTMANRKVKAETDFSVGNTSETATVYVTKDSEGNEFVLVYHRLVRSNSQYATDKVSVDNNTLALVNGELSDSYWSEVANSAFAVKPSDDLLYRYFATTDTVKIYRVNASEKEFLYEDATSKYSKDKDFNFLGVEDKGLTKNAALFLDTAYVNRGTQMPQYMLAVRPTIQKADTILCDAENHKHPTLEDALACPHTSIKPACVKAYYLVNLVDSVAAENDRLEGALINKYLLDNTKYTRLGFVEATHIGDSLIIANSIYTGNATQINPADSTTWASRDTINLSGNTHNPAVFSFRKVSADNDDFLIESESWGDLNGNNVKGETIAEQFAGKIAPSVGGWVKIQNGVPVIANGDYRESATEAEIFNIETTTEAPTANEGINASEVSIVAGNGVVIVKNAAGKNVAISNILGKTLVSTVLSSDNETISVPAGIVVVAVEGEEAVKAVVK